MYRTFKIITVFVVILIVQYYNILHYSIGKSGAYQA